MLRRVSRHALNDDVEHLLLLEHAADLDALEQGGLRTTDIARADSESLGLLQVDLDLDVRLGRLRLHLGLDDAVDLRHQIFDPLTLLGEDLRILSVQSNSDRGVQSGQEIETVARDLVRSLIERADVAELLGRVGRHLGGHPRHGDRGLLDQFDRVFVLDIGFHRDPDVAGVHVDHPVTGHRASDVRSHRRHAGQVAQDTAQLGGVLGHQLVGGTGRSLEPDQHVPVLEAGHQGRGQERNRRDHDQDARARHEQSRRQPATEPLKRQFVPVAGPVQPVVPGRPYATL